MRFKFTDSTGVFEVNLSENGQYYRFYSASRGWFRVLCKSLEIKVIPSIAKYGKNTPSNLLCCFGDRFVTKEAILAAKDEGAIIHLFKRCYVPYPGLTLTKKQKNAKLATCEKQLKKLIDKICRGPEEIDKNAWDIQNVRDNIRKPFEK